MALLLALAVNQGKNMIALVSRLTRTGLSRTRMAMLGTLSMVLLLGACQTTPDYPPAPQQAATPDYNYRIGPLDSINVIVWRNPELSIALPVRPDGKISTPLVDDLVAIGKTPTQLERDIEQALTKFIRDPVVTVIVTQFVGPVSEQIRVTGEATKPQILPYRQNLTLLDVMIAVGGLTDFADGNAATIYRASEGGKIYAVRLRDLIKRGDISANVDMKPGDILIIPQSWF
jgi:polysaccharide export outer membrane protein